METLSFPRYNVSELLVHIRNKILTGADGKNLSKADLYPNPKVSDWGGTDGVAGEVPGGRAPGLSPEWGKDSRAMAAVSTDTAAFVRTGKGSGRRVKEHHSFHGHGGLVLAHESWCKHPRRRCPWKLPALGRSGVAGSDGRRPPSFSC